MKMIGDGVVVDLADRSFLSADAGREIAEMVDGERNVGCHGFADRLAIVPGFGLGQHFQLVLHPLGDLHQDVGALGRCSAAPLVLCGMRSIERGVDVLLIRTRNFTQLAAGDRRDVVEILAADRLPPLAADVIAVFQLERRFDDFLVQHVILP
ncbi:hypothetical protein D3C80_1401650 [compost metagenome]